MLVPAGSRDQGEFRAIMVGMAQLVRSRRLRRLARPLAALLPLRRRLRLLHGATLAPRLVQLESLGVTAGVRQPILRVVVLKLDLIGDLVTAMPAMRALREAFPAAHMTLVCASWNCALAERLGLFDRVAGFDFFAPLNRDWTGGSARLQALYRAFAALPLEPCDLAVDLRHDPDTRPCLYRMPARYRAGFQAPAEAGLPSLDLMLPASEGFAPGAAGSLPAALRLQVLAAAVVAAFAQPRPHPAMALLPPARQPVGRPYAVLAIGAGDPIRHWPTERFAAVAQALIDRHGLDILVLGGAAERDDAARLAALLPAGRVRGVIGEPLVALPPLLAGAALCVCNGSGMSHLAAALDVPTVCVLGGTTRMEVWHPAGARAVALGGRTPCQPCGLHRREECPWDVACLTAVQPHHVLAACARLLAR